MQAKGASLEGRLQPASLPWVGSGSQPLALRTEEFTSPRAPRPLDVGTSAPAPALSIPYLTYPPLMSLGVLVVTWPWSLACLFPLVLYLENCQSPGLKAWPWGACAGSCHRGCEDGEEETGVRERPRLRGWTTRPRRSWAPGPGEGHPPGSPLTPSHTWEPKSRRAPSCTSPQADPPYPSPRCRTDGGVLP